MPTTALREFDKSLVAAERLLKLERRYNDPPTRRSLKTVEGLRGGAAVMMVAAFEQFLKACLSEHLAQLTSAPPARAFVDLPKRMQVESVFRSLDRAMKGSRQNPGERVDRIPDIVVVSQRILSGTIDVTALSDTQSNPGPDTVKELLQALGLRDPFAKIRPAFEAAWGHPEANTFVRDKLNEIVNRRHVVAHTADALRIARGDLAGAVTFLRVLAPAIDQVVRQQIRDIVSGAHVDP